MAKIELFRIEDVFGTWRQTQADHFNDGGVFDVVGTMTPRAVFTARVGFNRFKQSSQYTPMDISSLGFPKAFVGQLQDGAPHRRAADREELHQCLFGGQFFPRLEA